MSQDVSEFPAPAVCARQRARPLEAPAVAIESPPPARSRPATPARPAPRLHKLARGLTRTRNRRLLVEFLQLRRNAVSNIFLTPEPRTPEP